MRCSSADEESATCLVFIRCHWFNYGQGIKESIPQVDSWNSELKRLIGPRQLFKARNRRCINLTELGPKCFKAG